MNEIAIKITSILNRMVGMYSEFRLILIEEQGYLVADKSAELKECVEKKDKIANALIKIEEERLAAIIEASKEMGKGSEIVKIDEIATNVSKTISIELLSGRKKLLEIVAGVRALNIVNEQLLRDSMHYIKTAFEIVAGKQNR